MSLRSIDDLSEDEIQSHLEELYERKKLSADDHLEIKLLLEARNNLRMDDLDQSYFEGIG